MAYRKRTIRRRTRRSRKRFMRRMRPRRSVSGGIVNIKRTMVEAYYTLSNVWSGSQWQFRLDKLPDFAEFNTIFTQYRINAVKMTFVPLLDSVEATAQLSATSYITVPRLYAFVDKDSQPNLASENAVLQHSKLRIIKNTMKPFSVYCKYPAVSLGAATSSTVAYSSLKSKQWISCDSPSVVHNGVVTGGIIPFTGGSKSLAYSVIVTYYMQFKGTQ